MQNLCRHPQAYCILHNWPSVWIFADKLLPSLNHSTDIKIPELYPLDLQYLNLINGADGCVQIQQWRLQYQVIKNQVTRGRGVTALHSYNNRCLDGGLWQRKCFAPLLCYHSLLAPAKTAPAYIFNTFNTDGKIETLKYTGFQMEMHIITDQLCSIYNCCWMEPIFGPYFLDLCPCCQRLSVNIKNYETY